MGYRYIMINMLTKELTKKILYQTVITIEVLIVIPTTETPQVYKKYRL